MHHPKVIIVNGISPSDTYTTTDTKVKLPKITKQHHHHHHQPTVTSTDGCLKITTQLFQATQELVDTLNSATYPSSLHWTHLKRLKYSGLRIDKPRQLVKYLVEYSKILDMERTAAQTRQAARFGGRHANVVVTDFAAPSELVVLTDKIRRLRDQVHKYGVPYVFRSTDVVQQELDSIDAKFMAAIWKFSRLR